MKRNNLVTAVLAGIAGIAGIAGSAQAVNINPDGLGQVLIYPYYTTNNGNQTLISVVNTTDEAKAVKVRFLESLNSREVLDFNLYLSAYDVWTAALYDNLGVPTMQTADSSCTVPYFFGNGNGLGVQPFLVFAYSDNGIAPGDAGNNSDGGPNGIYRASEGHFEIIEMGSMYGAMAAAVTHVQPGNGPNTQEPANCDALVDAWTIAGTGGTDGIWITDSSEDISAPTGGLFGGAALINISEGSMFSYDAKALNGFWAGGVAATIRHTNPGDLLPSLNSGENNEALIFADDGSLGVFNYVDSVEAVSAMFMHDTVMNEYVIVNSLNARSEWVVTFPTKRFYTDPLATFGTAPEAPFTQALDVDGTSCEDFTMEFWDREEGEVTITTPGDGPIVSPKPPIVIPGETFFELCAETNVIAFVEDDGDSATPIPTATPIVGGGASAATLVQFGLPLGYDAGWLQINMVANRDATGAVQPDRVDSQGLLGLPVTGFWIEAFSNGTLNGGTTLANYAGIFQHKATRAQATSAP